MSNCEYAVPTIPFGNDDVETVSVAGLMVIVSEAVAVRDALSVTRTVNVLDPAAVGVPAMVAPVSVSPAGSVPLASDQAYGKLPPDAASDCEYAVPTVPAGRVDVVTVNEGAAAIVMENPWVSFPPVLSVTLTVKFAFPATVGVPLITPDEDRVKLAGKLPPEIVQLTGATAPVAVSVSE